MAAGHLVCSDSEALPGHPSLEVSREKTVVARDENAGRHNRPTLEGTRRAEHRRGLTWFALGPGLTDHRLRHVVKELDQRIEGSVDRPPPEPVLLMPGLFVARIRPPFAGALPGLRNHRVDQDQQSNRYLLADQRCGEAAERLRNEHDVPWLAVADRPDYGSDVLRQASRVVCRRERHSDGLVTTLLEPRCDQMPIPGAAACTRDQEEADARHFRKLLTASGALSARRARADTERAESRN